MEVKWPQIRQKRTRCITLVEKEKSRRRASPHELGKDTARHQALWQGKSSCGQTFSGRYQREDGNRIRIRTPVCRVTCLPDRGHMY